MSTPVKSVHRVNVNFSDAAWQTLDDLARELGKTKSEILRDAVALEKWFHEVRREGHRILVERGKGDVYEVIPR